MQKTLLLVDVQNIYYTTRDAFKKPFDYNQFWTEVSAGGEIVKAIAYAIDRGDEKQKQFQNILRAIGFEVKLKPYIQRSDGSAKGDWDVGITLDAMEFCEQVERIVLASGDGDFDLLVQRLRNRYGKRVEVYGVSQLTANSLVESCDQFHPIMGELLLTR